MQRTRAETSIVHALLWFALSYGIAILAYVVMNAAAGRWLGPPQFGHFVALLTLTGLLSQLGLVGAHRAGLREAARVRDQVDAAEQLAGLRAGVRAVHLTTLPAIGVVSGAVAAVISDADLANRVALGVIVTVLVVLSGHQRMWANYLRGFGRVRFASLVEGRSGGALVACVQAVLVAAVWLLAPSWGLLGALAAAAAGYVVPVAVARRVVHRCWAHVPFRAHLRRDLRRTVRRDWRFASVQVATYVNASMEIWLAGLILPAAATSMFTAGQRLAMLLILPMTALQVVLAPVIARLSTADQPESLERLLRSAATLALLATLVIWLPMVLAPGTVLTTVFGDAFGAAAPALLVLSIGSLVNVMTGLSGLTLSMSGREGIAARVQWMGVALRPVVGVPAAFLGGVLGLSMSAAVLSAAVFVVLWVRARQRLGVSTHVTVRPDLHLLRRTAG